MEHVRGKCKQCGLFKIINNSRGVCIDCVYKNNHEGKTRQQVALERRKTKDKGKGFKNNLTHSKGSKNKKKTGEYELFVEIWNERPHFCSNLICKQGINGKPKYLGEDLRVIFFSHRKSKGAFPELRLDKNNIDILCITCHQIWEFGNRDLVLYNK